MAIANIKDLWELAATILGGTAAAQIVDSNTDMSAPTTPLELTFTQFYDQVRTMVFEEADWLFARKTKELIPAPTKDWNGTVMNWDPGGRWDYAYQKPLDCVRIVGFSRDYPSLAPEDLYEIRRLPVNWTSVTSTGGTPPGYTFPAFSGYIYEGTVRVLLEDNLYKNYLAVDTRVDSGSFENEFIFTVNGSSATVPNIIDYNQSTGGTLRVDFPGLDWSSSYPANAVIVAGIEAASEDEWDEHIFCQHDNAVLSYVAEVADPSVWPRRFQTLVAAELALAAAGVHAKSSKQIKLIQEQVLRAREQAYEFLASNQGRDRINVGLSSAHLARL